MFFIKQLIIIKMSFNYLKLYTLNSVAMAVIFTNVENTLKIVLLIISILYTIIKTVQLVKTKKE
jgi:hypothetical protein